MAQAEGTATISVVSGNPGLKLIYVEGDELPKPEEKTHWEPLSFPAERPLVITVHAYYDQSGTTDKRFFAAVITTAIATSRRVNRDVLFECPPLEAGRDYKLTFRKGAGTTGKNFLVLTNTSTGKIILEQEFES
jgi:hypothetical protein